MWPTLEQTLSRSLLAVLLLWARVAIAVARYDSVCLSLRSLGDMLPDAQRHMSFTTSFISHNCISCRPSANADFSLLQTAFIVSHKKVNFCNPLQHLNIYLSHHIQSRAMVDVGVPISKYSTECVMLVQHSINIKAWTEHFQPLAVPVVAHANRAR